MCNRRMGDILTLCVLSLTALPSPATAQAQARLGVPEPVLGDPAVRRLTLEEAQQLAAARNPSLVLARLNILEKKYGIDAARKDYFPKLMSSVMYFHFNDDLGAINVSGKGKLGILPAGTPIISAAVANQDSTLTMVFLAQPITKLIAVNAAVQLARADEAAAAAQLAKGTREVLSGVAQAYHGLNGAQRIATTLQLQIQVLERLMKTTPLPEIRIGLVEAKQALVQVRGQVVELNQLLVNLLDLPDCTTLELVDPVPCELPLRCAGDAVQFALANNPEIREAEAAIGKAEAALRVAKMDYLPDVNLIGGYANQTAASYIQPNIGYFGVMANYTLWGWGKRRDVKLQRETLVSLANQNVAVARSKVTLEAQKAYGTYTQAHESFQLARELVDARRAAEKELQGLPLYHAKSDTDKAQLELMKAEIAYRVAHAQLSAVIGH
jgi:outer membrane protein TolC